MLSAATSSAATVCPTPPYASVLAGARGDLGFLAYVIFLGDVRVVWRGFAGARPAHLSERGTHSPTGHRCGLRRGALELK